MRPPALMDGSAVRVWGHVLTVSGKRVFRFGACQASKRLDRGAVVLLEFPVVARGWKFELQHSWDKSVIKKLMTDFKAQHQAEPCVADATAVLPQKKGSYRGGVNRPWVVSGFTTRIHRKG